MAKKRKLTATQRERRRVQQFIRRAEKRGFRFSSELKQKVKNGKWQTLRAMTPSKLYDKATALSKEGYITTGTKRRAEERSERSRKAARTRYYAEHPERKPALDIEGASFADTVLRNIENEIANCYGSKIKKRNKGARLLMGELQRQIAIYGREAVARSLEESPAEAKRYAYLAIYDSDDTVKEASLNLFLMLIKGEALSLDEQQAAGDIMDEYLDSEPEYED